MTKNAVGVMPVVCKWQMFLSIQLCFQEVPGIPEDLLSCMEEKFSDDCHDAICDEMSDTGAPCPGTGVGNFKFKIVKEVLLDKRRFIETFTN